MAEINTVTADFGAATGAGPFPRIYIPALGGNIKILKACLVGGGAGTSIGANLIVLSEQGTPAASGTVGAFSGTVVYAAGVRFNCTVSTANVDPGTAGVWLGLEQTSGTAPVNTVLAIAYAVGK